MLALRLHALISIRTILLSALCFAIFTTGCAKKQVRPTPPVLVPSIELPQPAPPPDTAPVENPDAVPETAPVDTHGQDAQKPKPKPRRPVTRKPPTPPIEQAKPEPAKPTTPDTSVQITADVPRAAVQSQKQNTEQLLRSSENKLGHINRNLNESEQGMLRQARNYIAQSNQALQGADVERAYNLAVKASLLANELTK